MNAIPTLGFAQARARAPENVTKNRGFRGFSDFHSPSYQHSPNHPPAPLPHHQAPPGISFLSPPTADRGSQVRALRHRARRHLALLRVRPLAEAALRGATPQGAALLRGAAARSRTAVVLAAGRKSAGRKSALGRAE